MGAGRRAPGGARVGWVAAAGALSASVALAAGAAGAAAPKPPTGPAASYCRAQGGTPQTRTPAFGTNNPGALALNGSLGFCKFRSSNGSSIFVDLRTLTSTKPTLAALAYLEKPPTPSSGNPSANPASIYCTKLGGSDSFGGANAAGGGWVSATDKQIATLQACVFPDLSIIDSWGLAYHANGVIRGKDLTKVLRYRPTSPPPVFS
jgi:putative hemolysin